MSYHQCSKQHCHIQDLFWTTKQQQQQLHHRMEKREVNQPEFAATCFCVHPQFQLYPSTTFAVIRTSSSSQNTPDRYSRDKSWIHCNGGITDKVINRCAT